MSWQDILNLGIEALSQTLSDQLLSHFILPVLVRCLRDESKEIKLMEPPLALFLLTQVRMLLWFGSTDLLCNITNLHLRRFSWCFIITHWSTAWLLHYLIPLLRASAMR